MMELRLLRPDESHLAADLHRRAGAQIAGYDTLSRPAAEFAKLYSEEVMVNGPVWGAFTEGRLLGHLALLPGWIDHLYVDPDAQGRGVGGRLVRWAQNEQGELRLYTFQSNTRARSLYERHGFTVEELTAGQRNEEQMPDMTYLWRAQGVRLSEPAP